MTSHKIMGANKYPVICPKFGTNHYTNSVSKFLSHFRKQTAVMMDTWDICNRKRMHTEPTMQPQSKAAAISWKWLHISSWCHQNIYIFDNWNPLQAQVHLLQNIKCENLTKINCQAVQWCGSNMMEPDHYKLNKICNHLTQPIANSTLSSHANVASSSLSCLRLLDVVSLDQTFPLFCMLLKHQGHIASEPVKTL